MPIVVPGIALAAGAILALIILWATGTFAKAVAGLIPAHGFVVGKLHNLVLAIGAVATAALQWIMADIIGPAFAFIAKPVFAIVQFIEAVQQLGRTMAHSWLWLLNSALPSIISKLERFAISKVTALKTYVLGRIKDLEKYVLSRIAAARTYALALYHKAVHDLTHLVSLARAYAHGLWHAEQVARVAAVAAARVYAHDLYNVAHKEIGLATKTLENEIKAITSVSLPDIDKAIAVSLGQAEDFATAAVSTALGVLATDVESAVAAVFDGLIIDVGALQDVIATDLPDIRALVDAIPTSLPVSIAGDLALSIAVSRVAIRYMEKCGIPNCRNLSKVGRDLQQLFGAIEGAGFLALIGYMVSDPDGAAHEAADVLGGIAGGLVDAARELIGV